jgi:hypothetical protein
MKLRLPESLATHRRECVSNVGGIYALLEWGTCQRSNAMSHCHQPAVPAEPAQQPLVDEIYEKLRPHAEATAQRIAKLLASKKPRELLGKTEYELRDLVHELAARAAEVGIESTSKKGLPGC